MAIEAFFDLSFAFQVLANHPSQQKDTLIFFIAVDNRRERERERRGIYIRKEKGEVVHRKKRLMSVNNNVFLAWIGGAVLIILFFFFSTSQASKLMGGNMLDTFVRVLKYNVLLVLQRISRVDWMDGWMDGCI